MARPKKKAEPVHVVARWESSPVVYGPRRCKSFDDVSDNPDYHPAICLTSTGAFVNDHGDPVDPKTVPARIREAAKTASLDIVYHPPKPRSLSMEDAMLGAGVADTDPDPTVRARRGRVSPRVFA